MTKSKPPEIVEVKPRNTGIWFLIMSVILCIAVVVYSSLAIGATKADMLGAFVTAVILIVAMTLIPYGFAWLVYWIVHGFRGRRGNREVEQGSTI